MYLVYILLIFSCILAVERVSKRRLETLQDELKMVKNGIDHLRITLDQLYTRIDNSERSIQELSDYHRVKRQSPKAIPVVGFTAATTNNKVNLTPRQKLVYETVITNVHHGYNKTNGVFTCPVSGQYQFAVSIIHSSDKKKVDAELVKNGVRLIHLVAHGDGCDNSCSHVVMTHCNKNQHVWVRHLKTQQGFSQMRTERPSYFSGRLIQAD